MEDYNENKHFQMQDELSDDEKKKVESEALRIIRMLKETFTTPMGKKTLLHLKAQFVDNRHIIRPEMSQRQIDMALGKRDLILELIQESEREA